VLSESETHPEAVELGWRHTVPDFERMFPSIVWVLVEEEGVPVAVASMQRQDDEAWLVVYTGVMPSHRGRGLARLVKEQLHALAASRGARALVTDNEARNTGILAVNRALGYQRIGGELRLIRTP
jgi:GNAT superfamily N-acetyltransferase